MTVLPAAALSLGAQVAVPTSRYNNQRTSVNANETILTPANVNSTNFGKLFFQSVDGYVFAQPLYIPSVTIGGVVHNVVYVATEHDSVYAFDADSNTGANAQPLWHASFLSSGVTTVPSTANNCTDILPEYGITGTPVIDTSTNTLYAVAETLENSGSSFVSRIHALDITTGLDKPGSPFAISASVAVERQSAVNFQSKVENQRPGLLLYNGVVYVGYSAHCDNNGWRGWILGYSYNQTNFSQVFVFSTEPSSATGVGGGIWMSGQGLSMDMGSNLFAATGNGQFDTTHTPPINYGDSIIRIDLSMGPTVQDYFTPYTQSTLDLNDGDLGSGGMAMLFNQAGPNPSLLVQAGKDSVIHVVNQTNMGHFNSSSDNIVQEVSGIGSFDASPVYFNGKVYFWANSDVVKAYTVTNGTLSTSPTDSGIDTFYFPGATPTISANGTSNAILWALNGDGWVEGSGPGSPAVLYAYNAADLSAGSIYNSNENLTRDNPGGAIKFAVPTVSNGKVYVGEAGELSVFGELVSSAPTITSANSTTFSVGTDGGFTVTTTGTPLPSVTETGTLPSGVTFVANANGTATLGGTPAAGMGGTYPLTLTASNGVGTPATQSFTLSISDALPLVGFNVTNQNPSDGSFTQLPVEGPQAGCPNPLGGCYPEGTVVTLTATPNAGFVFGSWKGYTGCGTGPICVVTMGTQAVVLTLSFAPASAPTPASVSVTPSSQSGAPGSQFSYTVSTAGFSGTPQISASCSIPMGSCAVSGSTLTATTTAPSAATVHDMRWLLPLGLCAAGLLCVPRRRRKTVLCVGTLALLAACGGTGSKPATSTPPPGVMAGTPAGTYTIQLSAASGATKATATAQLVIQ